MDIRTTYSKYLKSADLKGQEPTVTIASCTVEEVGQQKDMRPVLKFEGKEKGMVLNVGNSELIGAAYGYDTDSWPGRQVILYVVKVNFQGEMKDGLRVRIPPAQPQVASQPAPAVQPAVPQTASQEVLGGSTLPPVQAPAQQPVPQQAPPPSDDDIPF